MNRQPYQTPPRWWSPRLSPTWVRLWRPLRRRRGYWEHGLEGIEVRGLEHVRAAMEREQGVLITPNHPTHADPYVLLEAADRLGHPFCFMTAWQVFAMTHRLGRRVLRQHGCFSINREGHDLRAFRQAVQILERGTHPLVIFPEGEVFHLNDRVTPFRRGAATVALRAARRSNRPVACIPCGMKFIYVTDPTPELEAVMDRLEATLFWAPRRDMPLARRIRRFAEGMVSLKETEFLGGARSGRLRDRIDELVATILGRLEERYRVLAVRGTVPERVKHLRQQVIGRLEALAPGDRREVQLRRDLDDLFLATQLFSYPVDYLLENPSTERLAETVDKLEEDVLGVRTASGRGVRRAVVTFGSPVIAQPHHHRQRNAAELTGCLQQRVQHLLNELNREHAGQPATAPVVPELPASWLPEPTMV